MRRDLLELDAAVSRVYAAPALSMMDVEAIRLLLSGGSVVDWSQLAFRDLHEVDRYLRLQRLDVDDPIDRERLRYVFNEAVAYLEEHVGLRFPNDLRYCDDVRQVFLWASSTKGFRRRQILSCVILKLMHVIHHMEAADLKFKTAIAEQELFDLAEADILSRGRTMREMGLPVVSFYGSRKARSSTISKLIAKKATLATTIFDKLRFRIVVEEREQTIDALRFVVREMLPFNYVIPAESHNNLIDPTEVIARIGDADALQQLLDEPRRETTGKNEFSGRSYQMINFIVDYPVELPRGVSEGFAFELGRVVFVMVEFQILDEETARANEQGDNAHHLYKHRQQDTVIRRLLRGRSGR